MKIAKHKGPNTNNIMDKEGKKLKNEKITKKKLHDLTHDEYIFFKNVKLDDPSIKKIGEVVKNFIM
jgi:hypothetical protein